jgi:hypothetical protein
MRFPGYLTTLAPGLPVVSRVNVLHYPEAIREPELCHAIWQFGS